MLPCDAHCEHQVWFSVLLSLHQACSWQGSIPDTLLCPHPRAGVKNAEEDNSVAEVYLQAGPDAPRLRAQLDLLEQVTIAP